MSVDGEELDYVDLDDDEPDDVGATTESGDGAEQPTLAYGSVDEFVRDYLRHVYKRSLDPRNRRWAPDWWRYDEAVIRLEALWRAWEHLRLDPGTGMSTWLLHHADPQMAALFDKDGPFAAAAEVQTSRGDPLPYSPPPPGMFPDEREL
ncbi:DUF4913 domain-containing protein [Actinotalea ferrariae]|uniref:DUF4913 domain-containing protein n=1 Tax=Actinotalea ferrariae TaxID=1386098 RepID=UPI001C8C5E11|nr:DUF4913 domain-containing protein [Actinotalea ferrariae]MBX9246210.1 DUF4913 domain-containing protein [Actinotalea ferrariae]